jgi:tetratricopeptide (TPR) repeat protein
MAEPAALKYRAFISYSHADAASAKWLHRSLEDFRVDHELVGRETAIGPIPNTLKPIFRDRDDFTAGHTLSEQTLAALDASSALIVICSPSAAKSRYANEEIRLFKSRHPGRPVIPLIVAGKPGDSELECFPPALKFKLDAKGRITRKPVELLAADAREEGDGKALAMAKVVAGLVGVSSDEIFRRAERERRRKGRVRTGIVTVLAVLAVAATGSAAYAWQQLKTNEAFLNAALRRATEIVSTAVAQAQTYGVPRKATLELLTRAEGLFDDMARLGRPTAELEYRKALMLIEFARNYAILGDSQKRRQRADEAHRILVKLAAEWPNALHVQADLSNAYAELGNAAVAQGNLSTALSNYKLSLAIADRVAEAEPSNSTWQTFRASSSELIGDVLAEQNDLSGALKAYQTDHDIMARLAAANPDMVDWQRALAVSYMKIGDIFAKQGNPTSALANYREFLAIADRFAKANPRHAGRQGDLAAANERIGDVLTTQGDLAGALKSYQTVQAIFSRLAETDPDDAHSQRELFVSYSRLGRLKGLQADPAGALANYQAALGIIARLAEADPKNAGWQHDLFITHDDMGETLLAQGNVPAALDHFNAALVLARRLVAADPGNATWQRNLAVVHVKNADGLAARGDADAAFESYKTAHAIFEGLAAADPHNALWQRDVASSHGHLATSLARHGQAASALDELRKGRVVLVRLTEQSPDNATFASDLKWFDTEIAKLEGETVAAPTAQPEQVAAP